MTARSVPHHFREGLRQNLPNQTDNIIKVPQPNLVTELFANGNLNKDEVDDSNTSITDNSVGENNNFRRMKVTTSLWGKKTEEGQKPLTEDKLNIIYDSKDNYKQAQSTSQPDGQTIRNSSPEHLGIPAGPVHSPAQQKTSPLNVNTRTSMLSKIPANETTNDQQPKRDRNVKKHGGDRNVFKESVVTGSNTHIYTSDESCAESIPPLRTRHPPSNRRKVTKSSVGSAPTLAGIDQ